MAGGLIGALRVTLGIDTAAFEAGSKRARNTAVSDATAITKAYGSMKTAVAGLMAGISIGSIVAVTQRALDYASSLQEVAQQLGVTTKDLQEYRYAATQVGISQEEMDKGLAKLTLTMGKAREGAKEPVAAFKALSDILGKDILKNAATAGDAIPLIADALAKVKDPAVRAAYEMALFGKAGQKLDTLLAGGSAAVNELRDAAQELGVVLSDEQIQSADETADKLSALKMVLETNIAGVVADNASSILTLANALASLVNWLGEAVEGYKTFFKWASHKIDAAQGWTMTGGMVDGKDAAAARARWAKDQSDIDHPYAEWARDTKSRNARGQLVRGSGRTGSTGAGAGSAGGGGKPKRRAGGGGPKVDPAKQTDRYNDELSRLEDEQLRLQSSLTNSTAERAAYADRRITNDLESYQAELAEKVRQKEITAEQAKKLSLGKRFNIQLERDVEQQRVNDDKTREALEVENARLGLASDLKRGELAEARPQSERRTLQLQLLDIEYDRQRAALNAVLALNSSTQAEKDIAQARLDQLGTLKGQDARGVTRDTAGPMEAFGDSLHRTAGQIQEDFEQIQVDGIEALNDGLVDAIVNSKSLGDVFSNVAKQIIADLIRIQLREAMSSIFGGGNSGSGGGGGGLGKLLSGIGSLFGGKASAAGGGGSFSLGSGGMMSTPGFAKGGAFSIPGRAGIDTNLLSINGMPTARVNTGETLRIEPKNNGRPVQAFQIIPSPWFDVRAASAAEPSIQQMGVRAATGGSTMAQTQLGRRARQRLGR